MNRKKNQDTGSQPGTRQHAAPTLPGLLAGNVVPASMLDKQIPYYVPVWTTPVPTPPDGVQVKGLLGDDPLNRLTVTALPTAPVEMQLNADMQVEGVHRLSYSLQVMPGGQEEHADDLTIVIDRTPPVLDAPPNAVIFEQEVIDNGVTEAYLASKGDVLPVTLNYAAAEVDDQIILHWDKVDGEQHTVHVHVVKAGENSPFTLDIPAAEIRTSGDGDRMLRYLVRDLAGNPSGFGDYANVTVKLEEEEEEEGDVEPPGFPPLVIADLSDGTLNKDVILAREGLPMLIPAWSILPLPGMTDRVHVYWMKGHGPVADDPLDSYTHVDTYEVTGPIDPATFFPMEVTLPEDYLAPDGPFTVAYAVQTWNEVTSYSAPVRLISDSRAPWEGTITPAPVVPDQPITEDYLVANPLGVKWTLQPYEDFQQGDMLMFWWVTGDLPETPSPESAAGVIPITGMPFEVHVPVEHVRETGDGGCYLAYMVRDKATNFSDLSFYTRVKVALGALPDGFLPPEVPQAAEKGFIDMKDVHAGLIVEIPEFANVKSTDRVAVYWGGIALLREEIGSAPDWPMQIRVPDKVVEDAYGTSQGAVLTQFAYRVLRGDVEFELEINTVDVDLSVAGPELPDFPDPVNPALPLAEVYGEDSQTLNTLALEDNGKDAAFRFRMYTPAVAGEVVDIYWVDTRVAEAQYLVTGAEQPNDEIEVKVPWPYIEAAGNHLALPVHYRIGHPDSPNQQHSEMTHVLVEAVIITPDAPVFLGTAGTPENPLLTCSSLDGADHAVLVQVPDLSKYLADGDSVRLVWSPYDEKGGPLLDQAVKDETIPLDETTVKGFIWRVTPYATHILPTYESLQDPAGWASVQYSFTYENRLVTSKPAEAIVAMFHAGGSCPLDDER